MPIIKQDIRVGPESAGRVDRVVAALTGRSRAQVRGLIQHHCVQINREPCASDFDQVRDGDHVSVVYDDSRQYHDKPVTPAHAPFHILFEDDHLLVVDKSANLLTVPTPKHEPDTLVHLLAAHVSRGRKHPRRVEVVHRLDREVSGVLVFAKNTRVAAGLRDQFAAHKPQREYIALVSGRMEQDRGTFDKNLITDSHTIHRRVTHQPGLGERAVTHYTVEKRLPGMTRVRINLETGRRNQIRVHFADAGHAVLGDPRYAPAPVKHRRWPHRRMALHAATLVFTHPVTGKTMRFESPEPREFAL